MLLSFLRIVGEQSKPGTMDIFVSAKVLMPLTVSFRSSVTRQLVGIPSHILVHVAASLAVVGADEKEKNIYCYSI